MRNSTIPLKLWMERLSFSVDPPAPLCDICGRPVRVNNADMHHGVIRKGTVRGWEIEKKELLNDPLDLLIVHRTPCHKQAHARPVLCVAIQIVRYGWQRLDDWVYILPFRVAYEWHRGLDEQAARQLVKKEALWILS